MRKLALLSSTLFPGLLATAFSFSDFLISCVRFLQAKEEAAGIVRIVNEDTEATGADEPLCVLESSGGAEPEEAPLSNQNDNESGDVIYTHVNDEFEDEAEEVKPAAKPAAVSEAEKAAELEKAKEKAAKEKEALEKKEKAARADRERLCKLPVSPHLVVHPSKTAKGGRFECQLVSLAHLLDYRRDDNKESAFEVSLFAEYFNEMLVRDFGFMIYKHVLALRTEKDRELLSLAAASGNKRKLPSGACGAGADEKKEDAESKRVKPNEDAVK